jgi:PHIKZ305
MTVFNTEKTAEQYLDSRPFLNPEPGLVDTINKKFPAIWDLYKQMRGYDWSEDDITHESALIDFENAPKDTCDMMLKTLMWQWEADSVASRAPTVIIAPFNPAMEIWAAEQRITDNEQCLTESHEVFVKGKGWVSIKDVNVGDITLNYNPETKTVSFSPVINKIARLNSEPIYHYENSTRTFVQTVTAGHRMAINRKRNIGGWCNVVDTAENVAPHTLVQFHVSGNKLDGVHNITLEDRLWIAFQADGSWDKKYNGNRSGFRPMVFGLKKERKKERMRELLSALNYKWKESTYDSPHAIGYSHFTVYVPVSEWRESPKSFGWVDIDKVSSQWAKQFLDETQYWDGSSHKSSANCGKHLVSLYFSKNKAAVDVVCLLAHICSMRASAKLQKDGCWQVSINNKDTVNGGGITRNVQEADFVYCITVKEDGFLTRLGDTITATRNCHANTYSEIVRTGVPNATTVIEQLLAETETFRRLDTVAKTLGEIQHYSRTIALNGVDSEEAALNNLVLFYFTMLVLERIQFMASFAITFTIAESNWFQSIGQAVKLICRDEIEIHCQYRKAVIRAITATPNGKAAYERVKPQMQAILDEVTENELAWVDWLFEGRSLLGTNAKQIKQFVLFAVRDVATFAGLESAHKLPKENPMPFLVKWMDMSAMQAAPQEQDHGQYKFNTVTNDHQYEVFDI